MVEQSGARRFGPIESEPHNVRPPYEGRDILLAQGPSWGESIERWRLRVRCDRFGALCTPLAGLQVSAYEHSVLCGLCGWDDQTVAVIAALLQRTRAAAPLTSGGHAPAGGER